MPIYNTDTFVIEADTAPVDGAVNSDAQRDLYSDAKRQWLYSGKAVPNGLNIPADPDGILNGLDFPWTVEGGRLLPDGTRSPRFFFLNAPWNLKPYEGDHAWNISGNIFRADGTKLTVPTSGEFTVEVNVLTNVGPQGLVEAILQATLFGNVTVSEAMKRMYQRLQLDENAPVTFTNPPSGPGSTTFDDVTILHTGDGVTERIVTRQP